ncbi:MAG: hypothetical protein VW257_02865 [Quisquiliibacterium sp.]
MASYMKLSWIRVTDLFWLFNEIPWSGTTQVFLSLGLGRDAGIFFHGWSSTHTTVAL